MKIIQAKFSISFTRCQNKIKKDRKCRQWVQIRRFSNKDGVEKAHYECTKCGHKGSRRVKKDQTLTFFSA